MAESAPNNSTSRMGTTTSHPKKLQRSVSLRGSQRRKFLDFDMRLFRIDREITTNSKFSKELVTDIKGRLYFLEKEFLASNYKEKYEAEFRDMHRRIREKFENKLNQQKKEAKVLRRSRPKKRKAPSPPEVVKEEREQMIRVDGVWYDLLEPEAYSDWFDGGSSRRS